MTENIAAQVFSADRLAQWGERPALRCAGRELTYRQLATYAEQSSAALTDLGGNAGDRVMIRASDTEGQSAAILGALQAGFVPVILSPRLSDDDLAYVAGETGARFVIADHPECDGAVSFEAWPGAGEAPVPAAGEAFWLYSSGTTGRMKGVVHAHNDLAPVLRFHRDTLEVSPGTKTFCTSRLSFAYALSNGFLAPLALGGTLILYPDWPSPETTLQVVAEEAPDVVFSVPSMYRAWTEAPAENQAPLKDVLKFVSAGEHLPVPVAERWQEMTNRTILDCYGCSETCFLTFASVPPTQPGSVGAPCAEVEASLRDEEGAPIETPGVGSLFIRHPFLALSYGPEATSDAQARFDDGWFATGDIFRCDEDGYWFHDGREDDWLKVAGQWVSLRRVEARAGNVEGVAQAAAVAADDENGFLRIALFAVPAAGADPADTVTRLQAYLDENVPAHRRPKWIRAIDELPQTSTGKVRKVVLRQQIEDEHQGAGAS